MRNLRSQLITTQRYYSHLRLPPLSSPTPSLLIKASTLQLPSSKFCASHLNRLCFPSSKYDFSFPSYLPLRSSSNTASSEDNDEDPFQYEIAKEETVIDEWEEEDELEPQIGDGGDGGGIVLQNVPWGERALSIALEVLLQFGNDMKLYSFKTSPRGYVYVRLDKLSNEYGCPSMEEIESYSQEYKKRLEDEGSKGDIPDDLALEVSSPGAERILKIPDDLLRFENFPMQVCYVEGDIEAKFQEKIGVFLLDSIETETGHCVWKLADVRENRNPLSKGRPFSRKQKDWRLKLPHQNLKKVTLYLEF
ncbi:hypothetical protein Nepgr_003635 [Nepenthes gracilis]|uniref:DUF7912 domain-containing protein n=1 Tax=Nepenthes gracilis TaxID=150966 RepID=A0AAD3RZW2_NEPGR|nr:hypothetical protein Nepgr_003635 [Nepenthes gracilis]